MARPPRLAGNLALGRLAIFAGVWAPFLMWLTFLVFGLSRKGYNLIIDPASELGRAGTDWATLFNLGFFLVPGLGIAGFAGALYLRLGGRRSGRAAIGCIAVSGFSLAASGVIPMDGTSTANAVHRLVGVPLITALPAGILLLGFALPGQPRWHALRRLSLVTGSLLAALGVAYGLADPVPAGILQRASLFLISVWMLTIVLRLFKEPGRGGPTRLHPSRRRYERGRM